MLQKCGSFSSREKSCPLIKTQQVLWLHGTLVSWGLFEWKNRSMWNWFLPSWMSTKRTKIFDLDGLIPKCVFYCYCKYFLLQTDITWQSWFWCQVIIWLVIFREMKVLSNNKMDPTNTTCITSSYWKTGWIFALRLFHCFTVFQIWHTGASICSVPVFLWWILATGALPSCRSGSLPTAALMMVNDAGNLPLSHWQFGALNIIWVGSLK